MTTTTQPQARKPGTDRGIFTQAIAGRYRRITTHQLAMSWWLYQAGHITRRQLRVYFAAHEMSERRAAASASTSKSKPPRYELTELKALVGGRGSATADRDLSADVAQLRKLGLVQITSVGIEFAVSVEQLHLEGDLHGFWDFFRALPHARRAVPVPRRTLRALAAGFRRAETALIIASLIRSVFWRRKEQDYRIDGRTKLSWVGSTFGLSRRAVTDARTHLVKIGWLVPQDAPQWALNKWGAYHVVNTDWSPANDVSSVPAPVDNTDTAPVGEGGGSGGSASPQGTFSGESASPCLNRSSSSSRNLNNRTLGPDDLMVAVPGPSGVSQSNQEEQPKARSRPSRRRSDKPNIRDVQPDDLREASVLLELHRQAINIGLAQGGEAGQLDFFAMANRATAHGQRPGALLLWLLKHRKTEFITTADEETARGQLLELRDGPVRRSHGGGGGAASPQAGPRYSEDEALVLRCQKALPSLEPKPLFRQAQRHLPEGWTLERWESAHLSLRTKDAQRWAQGEDDGAIGSVLGAYPGVSVW